MQRPNPTLSRALTAALAAAVLAIAGAGSAAAEPDTDNPAVGGQALLRDGLIIDGSAAPLPPGAVKSFVVADLETGEILAAQNAHEQLPPASTLKMLTALTVLPRIDLDAVYTAVHDDAAVEGSKVGIVPDSTYTAQQLFEGLFLISGNDAAHAVANLNGGTQSTIDQMQAEAWRVQAYDTVVRNTSGLDAPGQVSSAYDLALIARAGLAREDFAEFAALDHSTFPAEGTGSPADRQTFEIWNQNDLVTGAYDGAIGVKSGFTSQAGRTFATAAERDGRAMLVTLMGIEGNTYRTGAAYLDWAFANADALQPVGELADPKYGLSQSDAAAVLAEPAAAVAASPVSLPSVANPASGRAPLILLAITLGSSAIIWLSLKRTQRKAWRRRHRAPAPAVVDLRNRDDVRV